MIRFFRFSEGNDMAILRLVYPVTFSDRIYAVCLPSAPVTEYELLTVAGWGKTATGGARSGNLKTVRLLIKLQNRSTIYQLFWPK